MTRTIALIPGDGIGPEVISAASGVLQAVRPDWALREVDAGFGTFQRGGQALPPESLEAARQADAILLGAVGSPLARTPGYRSPVVELRRELELFACLRQVDSLPGAEREVRLAVVRESTEGCYSGLETREGDEARLTRVITGEASRRVARFARDWALAHGFRRVTVVHKANVMRETCGLFREAALDVLGEVPELEVDERLVDSFAADLARSPEDFGVILTTNLFGDILSDLASIHGGGLGVAASANLGAERALFEPVHGSAPDIAGRGVANPIAAIRSAAQLLGHLGAETEQRRVERAVDQVLMDGPLTPDLGGSATTEQVTESVMDALEL